jgi:hypothetical protein
MSNIIISSGTVSYINSAGEWTPIGTTDSLMSIEVASETPKKIPAPNIVNKTFTLTFTVEKPHEKRALHRLWGMLLLWHRRN